MATVEPVTTAHEQQLDKGLKSGAWIPTATTTKTSVAAML